MTYNRDFVKRLPSYIRGEAYDQVDKAGNLVIVTVAVWEDEEKLNNAKVAVQAEFKRIKFNPAGFYRRLNIKLERGQYKPVRE